MIAIMLCIFFFNKKVIIAIGIKLKKSGKYNVYKYNVI